MAREHAQIKITMWGDESVRRLGPAAQHLYFVLLTSPTLSYCGVADWRPKRIAALARGWSEKAVNTAARELIAALFIVVDESTEEVLVRSFVRNDGVMSRDRMATAVAKAYANVASPALRGVIVHELRRLREQSPGLGGWGSDRALELLVMPSVEPSPELSVMPSVELSGILSGELSVMAQPIDTPELSVTRVRAPAPAPAPSSSSFTDSLRSSGEAVSAQSVTGAWIDACREGTGSQPSKSQIGQVAKLAKEMLVANDPDQVLAAARSAGARGYVTIDRELTASAGRSRTAAGGRAAQLKPWVEQ